ncbi:BtrH N-terminal domain-containing protein [candidate division KSB1 bacterium]|nr:BtrH N-terminal domain-containing protein [candidate division KSB1 bacterium]
MIINSYKLLGGKHPETATFKNALAALGVKAPHTGKPFTEAMLLGIAGGLGIGYILWEFKKHASAILVMAFQNKWNYPVKFTGNLCNRLGIKPVFKETGGTAAAEKHLREALDSGTPAIAWVDQFHLPYMYLPETYNGCMGWIVTAYGIDKTEKKVLIDDHGKKPLTLSPDEFAKARARIPSYKNRLLLLEAPQAIDLENAIIEGIRDCVNYLGAKSDTFALPAIAKWAKLMTDTKNPKGWPVVFKKKNGLYSTLTSIYEGIMLKDGDGDGLRAMYAGFLSEASAVFSTLRLKEIAAQYKKIANERSSNQRSLRQSAGAALRHSRCRGKSIGGIE